MSSAAPKKDPKSGTWWFVVDLQASGDGHRRQVKRRGFRTKAEAQAALDDLRVSSRRGTYVAPARQPLGEFLTQDWLPAIRATVEPSTHESYTRYLTRHVIPRIGGIPLQQLDAGILNRLYADLLDHGRLDGRPGGLSARTVRYIHTIIGRALREALAWDRVARNVAQAAQPPSTAQAQPPETRTWDGATVARFLECVREDRHYPAWLFLATTGCRRGEALGLRWSDVVSRRARSSSARPSPPSPMRSVWLPAQRPAGLARWNSTGQPSPRSGPYGPDRRRIGCFWVPRTQTTIWSSPGRTVSRCTRSTSRWPSTGV